MSGISNFLRSYEFLNLTKSVTESQMALYKEPNTTWAQIGSKFYNICWYNCEAVAAVGADVVTYLAVSTLRGCGLCHPLPPTPPTFPAPHDNVQFIQYAVKRALWNWDPDLRKEMQEGIADSLSDKWNVFQVVGEWSLAFSFENAAKSSLFKPTFLTISEPLENGESYRSIGTAFANLRPKEKTSILNALYEQDEAPSLSSKAKTVYQDIRALASKLHQGNLIYLNAFSKYAEKTDDSFDASESTDVSSADFEPSLDGDALTAAEIHFLHNTAMDAVNTLDSLTKSRIIKSVIEDKAGPLSQRSAPEILSTYPPAMSPKYFIARLSLLRLFKDYFQQENLPDCPRFFPWDTNLRNGKSLQEAGCGFAELSDQDFALLQKTITQPFSGRLSGNLREKMLELSEFADILHKQEDFLKTYEALRIDLIAN